VRLAGDDDKSSRMMAPRHSLHYLFSMRHKNDANTNSLAFWINLYSTEDDLITVMHQGRTGSAQPLSRWIEISNMDMWIRRIWRTELLTNFTYIANSLTSIQM